MNVNEVNLVKNQDAFDVRIRLGSAVSPLFDGAPCYPGHSEESICRLEGGSAPESIATWVHGVKAKVNGVHRGTTRSTMEAPRAN